MPVGEQTIRYYTHRNIAQLPQYQLLTEEAKFELDVVSHVLPFRVNNYVADELIDWEEVPDDPIYRLVFPQKGMLLPHHFELVANATRSGTSKERVGALVRQIQLSLNPHPAGQSTANVPVMGGEPVSGLQHKYRDSCLIFPASGQTCHSYCTYCFRWPQFVNLENFKFSTGRALRFQKYISHHKEVTDVILTGGDPMTMNYRNLAAYVEPFLEPEFDHIQNIRIGTKSLSYWPYRFLTDNDADNILALFERVVDAGKHLALMAHFNHWRELATEPARAAVARIRSTGAEIRTQSPLIRHINDDPNAWARMWSEQVRLGCIPYYMFIARDTGSKHYFAVPLARAWEIYQSAYQQVSGISRTVRGPSMSAYPGKVAVEGIADIRGERVFVLVMLRGRNPNWVRRPFFARFDPEATWLTDLRPAFGKERFFFEQHEVPTPVDWSTGDGAATSIAWRPKPIA